VSGDGAGRAADCCAGPAAAAGDGRYSRPCSGTDPRAAQRPLLLRSHVRACDDSDAIWGIAGAFLAAPVMACLALIFAEFEGTRPIAVLLSKNGRI
jgi:hypothetical protein